MEKRSDNKKPKIYLAPMRGFTDYVYRNVYTRHFKGVDLAVAPFITSVKGKQVKQSHLKDVLPENNHGMPVIPQILSKDAGEFIVMADALFQLGYKKINWNLGCPYPMVAKKGRGSGLLCVPDTLDRLFDEIMSHIACRLSIKTRLGRHSVSEIEALMPVFNRYDIDELIVHPRTGVQMYEGKPDLNMFAYCVDQSRHRIVYNGDIVSKETFEVVSKRFPGISSWMVGRGILMDPLLPEKLFGDAEFGDTFKERFKGFHWDLFCAYEEKLYGPSHLLDRMKGLWRYFAAGFPSGKKALKKIRKAKTIDQYKNAFSALLESSDR